MFLGWAPDGSALQAEVDHLRREKNRAPQAPRATSSHTRLPRPFVRIVTWLLHRVCSGSARSSLEPRTLVREVHWLPLASSFVALASLLLTWACHRCAHRRLLTPASRASEHPPISILRPLCGLDDQLYQNLVSVAEQRYPEFELILGLADPADPARGVAQRLQAEYPELRIQIVCDSRCRGFNPKVSNLENMLPHARHEHLLVSDSNVLLEPDFLRRVLSELQRPGTGLVVNLIVGVGERTLGAALENLHLNSYVLSTLCGARALLHHTCAIGKSMLFTRTGLGRVGGLVGVRNVLAEDYILGQRFEAAGYRVGLCNELVRTVNARRGLAQVWSRQLRWAQMRRHLRLDAYLVELLMNPLVWLGLSLVSAAPVLHERPEHLLALGSACLALFLHKAWSDLTLAAEVNRPLPLVRGLALVATRDALMFVVWFVALFKRSLDWRGNRLVIGAGSALSLPRVLAEEESAEVKVEG
jgi:ceramide glucosyltransferase